MSVEFNQNLLNNNENINKGDSVSNNESNNASETVNTAQSTGDSVQSTQGSTESSIPVENQNEAQNQVNKQREERISISALEKIRNLFTNNSEPSVKPDVKNTAAPIVPDVNERVVEDKPQVDPQVKEQPTVTEPPAAPVKEKVVREEPEPVKEVIREVAAAADPNELFKNQDFINNLSTVILEINKSTQEINNNPVKQPQVQETPKPAATTVEYDINARTGRDMYGRKL